MNVIDIVIIVVILFGAIIGFKRGALSEFLTFFGFFIIVLGSFLLKNKVSEFLYLNLPFFKFHGLLNGVTAINILLYEVISFFIVFIVLYIIFKSTVLVSKIFKKFFDASIIISIPMKIGGAILGIIENYLFLFIVLYLMSIPFLDNDIVKNSKLRKVILEKTPIINMYVENTVNVGREFWDIADKYKTNADQENLNLETINLLLKYNVTKVESIDILVDKNKIQINNIESVLINYRD